MMQTRLPSITIPWTLSQKSHTSQPHISLAGLANGNTLTSLIIQKPGAVDVNQESGEY